MILGCWSKFSFAFLRNFCWRTCWVLPLQQEPHLCFCFTSCFSFSRGDLGSCCGCWFTKMQWVPRRGVGKVSFCQAIASTNSSPRSCFVLPSCMSLALFSIGNTPRRVVFICLSDWLFTPSTICSPASTLLNAWITRGTIFGSLSSMSFPEWLSAPSVKQSWWMSDCRNTSITAPVSIVQPKKSSNVEKSKPRKRCWFLRLRRRLLFLFLLRPLPPPHNHRPRFQS